MGGALGVVVGGAVIGAMLGACGRAGASDPGAAMTILGESTRYRVGDPLPRVTPWFDGTRVSLVAARGETLGLQVIRAHDRASNAHLVASDSGQLAQSLASENAQMVASDNDHLVASNVRVSIPGIDVRVFDVELFDVTRPSTELYGGSRGRGRYADGLVPRTVSKATASNATGASNATPTSSATEASSATGPIYIELRIPRDARPGTLVGELLVGDARYPIELVIARITIPERAPRVWAYEDPRELAWATATSAPSTSAPMTSVPTTSAPTTSAMPSRAVPSAEERACAAVFRDHGVLLSPDLHLDGWPARQADFAGVRDVPVVISDDPAKAGDDVRAWIAATKGTGHVPFAIPIDEPRTPERIREVVELGKVIRAAGGGPHTFRFAVTADPRPAWIGLVDQFIQLDPAPRSGAWAYNGSPPWAGAVVLDAETPGTRTWGWVAHRDGIAQWYVWDALYWHDRHNRQGGRALDPARDPISFDDGDDRGNLDGVLALPGCRPTLRLAALRRGQQDRALLELANACDPIATAGVVARTMPARRWPTDESVWERSRRELIRIAGCR